MGTRKRTVAPDGESMIIAVPPCARATARAIASPSPVPLPARFGAPRAKRSNACVTNSGGKPGPFVAHVELERIAGVARGEPDVAGPVTRGVVNEVAERLTATQRVYRHPKVARGVDMDRAALLAGAVGEALCGLLEQLSDVDQLAPHGEATVGGAGDQQQVVGELGKVVGLLERGKQGDAHLRVVVLVADRGFELGCIFDRREGVHFQPALTRGYARRMAPAQGSAGGARFPEDGLLWTPPT
jgi:hypothetical protein